MNSIIKYLMVITLIIGTLLFTACDSDEHAGYVVDTINLEIEACTGTCLTREELAQLVYNYEKVQENHSGKEIEDGLHVPDLKLETPGKHEHDDKTRYQITTLEKDKSDIYTGIKVSVMDDTSACNIEEPEVQEIVGLPVEEIVGTYVVKADVTVSAKDKDDKAGEGTEIGSTEMEFTYIIAVVDGNKISIETQGIKAAEGVYNPTTGICDFKTSQDRTERFTFSKQDGQVQFKSIQLGKEDAVPAIGIKIE